jgi:hypothetical protein
MPTLELGDVSTAELDIYFTLNGSPIDPSSVSFDIKNTNDTVVSSGVGYQIETGHYDARNGSIPSSNSTGDWTIVWTYITPGGNTLSATEEFSVVSSLAGSGFLGGTDVDQIITSVRIDIGDDGDTQTYTDAKLLQFVSKATIMLNARLDNTSESGVFQFNGTTFERALTYREKNLYILQIECLLNKREYRTSAAQGMRFRDGDTEVDTVGRLPAFDKFVSGPGSACDLLEIAIKDYNNEIGNATPAEYGIIWRGNVRRAEQHSHDDSFGGSKFEIMLDFDDYFGGRTETIGHSNDW